MGHRPQRNSDRKLSHHALRRGVSAGVADALAFDADRVRAVVARIPRAVGRGDAFDRKKPDPLPLLKTCEALGTMPARTLMVGDSSNDAQAARAAGCPVVLVSYGYNHGQPVRQVDADAVVDSLAELTALAGRATLG